MLLFQKREKTFIQIIKTKLIRKDCNHHKIFLKKKENILDQKPKRKVYVLIITNS